MTQAPHHIQVKHFTGPEVTPWLPELAQLRIDVFREYPYVYEGTTAYEMTYLEKYARSLKSIFVVAFDENNRVLGASTGLPLADADPAFQSPFIVQQIPLETVFYFGESVLAPAARGQGIGHRFFDERESFAQANGFEIAAFCAVERPPEHPRLPADYRPHDDFWHKRGYARQSAMRCQFAWKDVGESEETEKEMVFWLRRL